MAFDRWLKDPPYTARELGKLRSNLLKQLGYLPSEHGGLTCDGCHDRAKCVLAYDSYNINGDCLLEK